MNIQMQLCGLLILLLLHIFYRSSKNLQLYTERIFYYTMCVATVSLCLDMLSLVVIRYRQQLPMVLVNGVCKVYIISLVWVTMSALKYVLTDLFSEMLHKNKAKILNTICIFQGILVALLPIRIYENGKQVYTYGPAVLGVYTFVALYMLATIIVMIKFHQKMNKRRVLAICLWMGIWFVAALIQFIINELLIVGFASAIGMLILFVIIENPEANLDKKLGCFNSYALTEYVRGLMESGENFSLLEISFGKLQALEEYGVDMVSVLQKVLQSVKRHTHALAFRNINSNLLVVGNNSKQLNELGKIVLDILSDYDVLHKEVMTTLVVQGNSFRETNDLFHFLTFVRNRYGNDKSKVFLADEAVIMKFRERTLIEFKIREALEEDRVEVFFQPIYSNREGAFTSAEALVRIRERDGNLLPPGIFIPIAEQSGQIVEMGDRVFEKVCEFLKNTNIKEIGLRSIEINLSVVQCEMVDLADRLISIIEKYGVEPAMINLEITETASINAKAILEENMRKLISYGFTFALDDFGKGESNLMYVVEMPVSFVKLDYDMSKAYFSSKKARHVVKAVVAMAHDMDMKLVAEGIETEEEKERICKEGIDYIQGYYYSRPLPVDEFIRFIRSNNMKNRE